MPDHNLSSNNISINIDVSIPALETVIPYKITNSSVYLRNNTLNVVNLGVLKLNPNESILIWDDLQNQTIAIDNFYEVLYNIAIFNKNIESGDFVLVYNNIDLNYNNIDLNYNIAFSVFGDIQIAYSEIIPRLKIPSKYISYDISKSLNEKYDIQSVIDDLSNRLYSNDGYQEIYYKLPVNVGSPYFIKYEIYSDDVNFLLATSAEFLIRKFNGNEYALDANIVESQSNYILLTRNLNQGDFPDIETVTLVPRIVVNGGTIYGYPKKILVVNVFDYYR